ncbi:hypothetical protein BOX15_Mlig003946g1 [Macrostomum lignano]|uniref:alpha-1,2-Mannosidase n=1 Tax=Macrostomum lignano TaxID=282301 RepID=A0A267EXG0_9PLAT|nr:hypothetical protein BOX15_Mlig003946g1 [Macrostomum lignano]
MLQQPTSRGYPYLFRHTKIVLPTICLLILMPYLYMHQRYMIIDIGPLIPDDAATDLKLIDINEAEMTVAVKEMTRFAWRNYVKYCARPYTGNDLDPIKRACSPVPDVLLGPRQLVTAVDALDTFAIMEMHEEFEEARQMVTGGKRAALSNVTVSVFETCIRLLGGYLGAYSFTQDSRLLAEAVAVADRLAESFSKPDSLNRNGTLYLEFVYLSHITGDKKYEQWVTRNHELLIKAPNVQGLYPMEMTPKGMPLTPDPVYSAGGGGDSFYEYLVKKCLYSKNPDPKCTRDYTAALDSIMKCMTVQVSPVSDLLCVVNVKKPCYAKQQLNATCTMEHLTCFLGGTYALAYMMNPHRTDWLRFAERITHTCYLSYFHSPIGLGPEIFKYNATSRKFEADPDRDFYILRPETIESIYYLHYVTGHKKYRYWGKKILLAINASTRTPTGFSGVHKILSNKTIFDNTQQSFFLAETLKYLYLLFQPNSRLSLDQWVLSTEAHLFPTGINPLRSRMHG